MSDTLEDLEFEEVITEKLPHEVGDLLPNGATITRVETEIRLDGSKIEEVWDSHGNYSHSTEFSEGSEQWNNQEMQNFLKNCLVHNFTFLATINSSQFVQEDLLVQIKSLTKQISALIRLSLNRFETSAGAR